MANPLISLQELQVFHDRLVQEHEEKRQDARYLEMKRICLQKVPKLEVVCEDYNQQVKYLIDELEALEVCISVIRQNMMEHADVNNCT